MKLRKINEILNVTELPKEIASKGQLSAVYEGRKVNCEGYPYFRLVVIDPSPKYPVPSITYVGPNLPVEITNGCAIRPISDEWQYVDIVVHTDYLISLESFINEMKILYGNVEFKAVTEKVDPFEGHRGWKDSIYGSTLGGAK